MSTTPTGDDMGVGLVGDIGATNARFRLVSRRHEWISDLLVLPTTRFNDGADVLLAVRAHFEIPSVAQCVLAVAGPVSDDGLFVRVVNTGLTFNQVAVQEVLGVSPVLRNDFFVQAQSVPYLKELVQIGGDKAAAGVKAILGPGSGLGMATLVPNEAGKLTVLSSEGGHGDLAPGSTLDNAYGTQDLVQSCKCGWYEVQTAYGAETFESNTTVNNFWNTCHDNSFAALGRKIIYCGIRLKGFSTISGLNLIPSTFT